MFHTNCATVVVVGNGPDDAQEELVNEAEISTEFDAWNELRLHPLLMKSIYKLGFKESTSILKARIPALAHQRKVVRSFFISNYV